MSRNVNVQEQQLDQNGKLLKYYSQSEERKYYHCQDRKPLEELVK